MKRKIIQIAVSSTPISQHAYGRDITVALCDDGTAWSLVELSEAGYRDWEQLPDIPQPKEEDKGAQG